MKRFLLILLTLFIPATAFALSGDAVRFDFTDGQPAVVDDDTSICNHQPTVRYDFTQGQPDQVFDSTATCANVVSGLPSESQLIVGQGQFILKQGQLILE